ncbi:hypothetical protein CYMTET_16589, partial [Cymbomonas tetramitiformis]
MPNFLSDVREARQAREARRDRMSENERLINRDPWDVMADAQVDTSEVAHGPLDLGDDGRGRHRLQGMVRRQQYSTEESMDSFPVPQPIQLNSMLGQHLDRHHRRAHARLSEDALRNIVSRIYAEHTDLDASMGYTTSDPQGATLAAISCRVGSFAPPPRKNHPRPLSATTLWLHLLPALFPPGRRVYPFILLTLLPATNRLFVAGYAVGYLLKPCCCLCTRRAGMGGCETSAGGGTGFAHGEPAW